ncbi:MAG: hydroxymethylbilane synthase [Candidatus Sericytochromatia bacterium]|nr:hydroxymethylbilane synthase [Candidatus Sericytochromatia bacterium]
MIEVSRRLRFGTRGSPLALWQTEHVCERLRETFPALSIETVVIKTSGDKILDVPLARIGDRGLFVKEIEQALLANEIDVAVHSLKDLPTHTPPGLMIGAVMEREDPRDCLISERYACLAKMPPGAVVGTSSLRRRAQLQRAYPALRFEDVRGNLQTRLAKLDNGHYDALILAVAGLKRLGFEGRIREIISPSICLPAVGQGVLAVECRAEDIAVLDYLAPLENAATRACVTAERSFLSSLEGGCQVPIGAHARLEGDVIHLEGLVAALAGNPCLRDRARAPAASAVVLGETLAHTMKVHGAEKILQDARDEFGG